MNGLPYYKAYPRDFLDATISWPLDLKGAYRIVIDLIYYRGGDLPDDPRYIAGQLGCSVRAWNGYRQKLLDLGKLTVENGLISNFRASLELVISAKFQDNQREKGSKPKKTKALAETVDKPARGLIQISDTDTSPIGEAQNVDFAKAIFENGVAFLGRHGVKEKQARAVIGKWRKDHGDKFLFDAFAACNKAGATDPIPWITARLGAVVTGQKKSEDVWAEVERRVQ
jgi:uncharacterized protein YdaU (DUF1376 family)